jgi:hypothetical protein
VINLFAQCGVSPAEARGYGEERALSAAGRVLVSGGLLPGSVPA